MRAAERGGALGAQEGVAAGPAELVRLGPQAQDAVRLCRVEAQELPPPAGVVQVGPEPWLLLGGV